MRELSGVSFERALSLFMRAIPSWPNYFPNDPFLNTITLGVRILWWNTNIQFIAALALCFEP